MTLSVREELDTIFKPVRVKCRDDMVYFVKEILDRGEIKDEHGWMIGFHVSIEDAVRYNEMKEKPYINDGWIYLQMLGGRRNLAQDELERMVKYFHFHPDFLEKRIQWLNSIDELLGRHLHGSPQDKWYFLKSEKLKK